MKLLDKLKNAIFEEEEEFDEEFKEEEVPKKKIVRDEEDEELRKRFRKRAMEERLKAEKEQKEEEVAPEEPAEIVKQIDVEKTIPKKEEPEDIAGLLSEETFEEEPIKKQFPKRESRRTPIIFDEEDFDDSVEKISKPKPEEEKKAASKTLYGGYRDDNTKEKFKPSPNISPVYGLVEVSPVLNKENNKKQPKENHVYVPKKQEDVSLDEVRQKAFGNEPYFEEDDDLGLLYDMQKDDKPALSKVTLGDAEEYFDDLGLEYNVDYTDKKPSKPTRSVKNEELTKKVEDEIQEEEETEVLEELEITKEQIKPRTAEEIKKIKKIENADLDEKEEEDPDEKNLYDLIDMMYDSE